MGLSTVKCIHSPLNVQLEPTPVSLTPLTQRSSVSYTNNASWTTELIHITDIHYDPDYVEGHESEEIRDVCEHTKACCRTGNLETRDETHWGNYQHCDTPKSLLDSSLKAIAERHPNARFVYLTGDLVRHHVTEVDFEKLKEDSEYVFKKIMETFPNIPIVFAIGTRDTSLFGMFSSNALSGDVGQREVYQFYKEWTEKLWKNGQITQNFREIEWPENGGELYYTIPMKERLRVIVLNSNVAYVGNWWLLTGHFYGEQLQWLQDVLAEAEQYHQKVHILSHIPPNHSALLSGWSRQYQRIIDRYRDTIVAQFNGHSHYDEFALFYGSEDPDTPISVAWNGGSLTPYSGYNPNYHVVTLESEKFSVSALESYIIDLEVANKHPGKDPEWRLSFNMTKEYDLQDLSLKSLDELATRMTTDEKLIETYYNNKKKQSPSVKLPLSDNCKKHAICDIVSVDATNGGKCKELRDKITWTVDSIVDTTD